MKNPVLIGYRGVGKTEVSRVLSEKLGKIVISLDEEIVKETGMNIPLFVKECGWEAFRDIETKVIKKFSRLSNVIIDTGGGAILREENVRNLRENGVTFLLKADVKTIKNRIKDSKDRPPLTDLKSTIDEIETVLKQREEKYNDAADYIIKTDNLSVDKVADEILKFLKNC
jgi:shikimate kinase